LPSGGVDTTTFDPRSVRPAADVLAVPAPRVGLVGTVDDRLDVAALARCARMLPAISFVLAGPIKRHRVNLEQLRAEPNVYFLPERPYAGVAGAMVALDVGLIPYQQSAYGAALSPIKLYEYLALEKPVVGADLPYLRREASAIRIAGNAEEYAAHITELLASPPGEDQRAEWRRIATAHSWSRQVDQIEAYLAALPALTGMPTS
jgi:glycosyltransferase involved in cell wall biosynthesis